MICSSQLERSFLTRRSSSSRSLRSSSLDASSHGAAATTVARRSRREIWSNCATAASARSSQIACLTDSASCSASARIASPVTSGLPSERARSRSAAIARRTAGMPPAARRSAMGRCSAARLSSRRSRWAVPGSKRDTVRRGAACASAERPVAACPVSVRVRAPAGAPGRRVAPGVRGRRSPSGVLARPSAPRGAPPVGAPSGRGRRSGLRSPWGVPGRPSTLRGGPPVGAPSGRGRRSTRTSLTPSGAPVAGRGRRVSGRSAPRGTTIARGTSIPAARAVEQIAAVAAARF